MKKRYRYVIIFILIFVVLLVAVFSFSYYLLATNFISSKVTLDLEYKVENIQEKINTKVEDDYNYFKSFLSENPSISDETLKDNETLKTRFKVENINYARYNESGITLNSISYKFSNINDYTNYYKNNFSIYSFKELFDVEDDTTYIVFRSNDLIIYFDSYDYFENLFEIDSISNYYIVFEKTGYIVYQKDKDSTTDILFFDYINDYNTKYDYSKISEKLYSNLGGNEVLNFGDTKSIFVFYPILKDSFDQDLFIGYAFNYSESIKSMKYLNVTFLVLGFSIILIIACILGIVSFRGAIKDQDIYNLSGIKVFTKPFTIKIKKNGEIIFANKSCYRNIKNFSDYKNVLDFELFENNDTIMNVLSNQKSFIVDFKSFTDEDIYVHFIPLKMFNRYFLTGDDVTGELQEQIHNKKIAMYNSVTNLPNGNLLNKALKKLVESPIYLSSNVSIASIEIIDFAKINKLYGYSSADTMVREVAKIISDNTKKLSGTVEIYNIRTSLFAILFIGTITHNEVIACAKNIIDKLCEPINIRSDYMVQVSPRMGLFTIPNDLKSSISAKDIYDNVMISLERSKTSTISKISIYNSDLGQALSRDQIMEEDLREGIKNDEFVMFFQPQFNIKTNKIVGVESLLRWSNPKYKTESPEKYIKLAEKNGMIIDLGRLIIDKVFKYAKSIEGSNISVSLNVSPVQLLQSGFVYELLKSYEDYKLAPGAVAIEITETFLMENKDVMISKLRLLKDKGFTIHLDDFGMGYSSMFYLKDLPVDAIKIDKEFSKYMVTDKTTKSIVGKIVQLGLGLGLELIAEGVETDKQKDMLFKMGCEIIQGYLISKPLCMKDSYEIIKKLNNYEIKSEE